MQQLARQHYPPYIARLDRWIAHYHNRLAYERALLAAGGGTVADRTKPEKGGAVRCWASPNFGRGWAYRVNQVSVTIHDKPSYGDRLLRVRVTASRSRPLGYSKEGRLRPSGDDPIAHIHVAADAAGLRGAAPTAR